MKIFVGVNIPFVILILILISSFPVHSTNTSHSHDEDGEKEENYPTLYVWLYSFLAIMLVSASGFIGILLVPFMNRSLYNVSTQFLIALSVGSLIGDAFFHLIPHALTDHSHDHSSDESKNSHHKVIYKSLLILLGIYAFFITERITILYQNNSTRKKMKRSWVENSKMKKLAKDHPTKAHSIEYGGQNEALIPSKNTDDEIGLIKSMSNDSLCSIDCQDVCSDLKSCDEKLKDPILKDDHSHLICSIKTPGCNSLPSQISNENSEKCMVNYIEEKAIRKTNEDESKGMRSHVGGVDTAPPSFSIPLRCHHVNMRHCRSPNLHHNLHQRLYHIKTPHHSHHARNSHMSHGGKESKKRRALSASNIADQSIGEMKNNNRFQSFLSKFRYSKDIKTSADEEEEDQEWGRLRTPDLVDTDHNEEKMLSINTKTLATTDKCDHSNGLPEETHSQNSPNSTHGKKKRHGREKHKSSHSHSHKNSSGKHNHFHCLPSGFTFVSPLRDKPHGHHHGHSHDLSSVRSIAYTIIAGDGLHNFCDGIAIGATFASNKKVGLSTFLAVICHELPHELGDFAVLLNAGMPLKTVIFYNCLTGVFCFTGMILGVLISNISEIVNDWLFLVTAGIFIYIALVDMVPELATQRLKGRYSFHKPSVLFLAQNLGLFVGVGFMVAISFTD